MIEGEALTGLSVNSRWHARLGGGCELRVALSSGRQLYVIRTELPDVDAEIERWRQQRLGRSIETATELTSWPLAPAGRQVTLDITLDDGFRFEGDLIEAPDRETTPVDELETEWTFEGVPGIEMGAQQGSDPTRRS